MHKPERDLLLHLGMVADHNHEFPCSVITDQYVSSFSSLKRSGLVRKGKHGCFQLTPSGLDALETQQELDEQRAERAANERNANKSKYLHDLTVALVSAAVGSILTVILDYLIHCPLLLLPDTISYERKGRCTNEYQSAF